MRMIYSLYEVSRSFRSSFCQVCVSCRAFSPLGINVFGLTWPWQGFCCNSDTCCWGQSWRFLPEESLWGEGGFQISNIWKDKWAHFAGISTAALNKQHQTRGQGPEEKNKGERKVFCVEKQRDQRPRQPGTKPPGQERLNKSWLLTPGILSGYRDRVLLGGRECPPSLLGGQAQHPQSGPWPTKELISANGLSPSKEHPRATCHPPQHRAWWEMSSFFCFPCTGKISACCFQLIEITRSSCSKTQYPDFFKTLEIITGNIYDQCPFHTYL